jgi:hypothetical protein
VDVHTNTEPTVLQVEDIEEHRFIKSTSIMHFNQQSEQYQQTPPISPLKESKTAVSSAT